MIYIVIVICSILGIVLGMNLPTISYSYSGYLAIAIIAALDSVFGGITSILNKNFDIKIFVSGFFGNAILAMLLTYLGEKLNVDIYLAAVIVFGMDNHMWFKIIFYMFFQGKVLCLPDNL